MKLHPKTARFVLTAACPVALAACGNLGFKYEAPRDPDLFLLPLIFVGVTLLALTAPPVRNLTRRIVSVVRDRARSLRAA